MKTIAVKQDPEKEIPVEIIASAILDISKAMKQINGTRLTRSAIVAALEAVAMYEGI